MLNTVLLIIILALVIIIAVITILNKVEETKDYQLYNKYMDAKEDNSNLWDFIDYLQVIIDTHNDKDDGEHQIEYQIYTRWMSHRLSPDDDNDVMIKNKSL